MAQDIQFPIIERYISEWALPNEAIVSWLKWDEKIHVQRIKVKYEADIFIPRFLNVDVKVFDQDFSSGEVVIPSEYLQIPGFFGFHALYTKIPEEERKVEFVIQLYLDDNKVHVERLSTSLTRPILYASITPADIVIEEDVPFDGAIGIQIGNLGTVHAKDATITFNLHTTSDLNVLLKAGRVPDRRHDNLAEEVPMNAMTIRGKGRALVSIAVEYTDNLNNKYQANLATITLDVKKASHEEIPFTGLKSESELPLLLAV